MTAIIHGTNDGASCEQWAFGDTFVCQQCGCTCGYLEGCADDEPDLCDDCWEKKHERIAAECK